jgi:hypothetical protein
VAGKRKTPEQSGGMTRGHEFVARRAPFRFGAFGAKQVAKAWGTPHQFPSGRHLKTLGDRFFGFLH